VVVAPAHWTQTVKHWYRHRVAPICSVELRPPLIPNSAFVSKNFRPFVIASRFRPNDPAHGVLLYVRFGVAHILDSLERFGDR